jgi:hypothetical protein
VEYWHMGATMMRLRSVTSRIFSGVKRVGVLVLAEVFVEGGKGAPGVLRWAGV